MILGTMRYGRVDRVPGRFYVATQFVHFCFLPFLPLQSYVIQREDVATFQGIPIPMSLKSVFITWGRTILVLYVVTTSWAMWQQGTFLQAQLAWSGCAAAAFVGSLFYMPRAGYMRAVQLGLAAGVAPSEIAKQFGREVRDAETLARLSQELSPTTADGKPRLGHAGKFFGGMVLLALGVWVTRYGVAELLEWGGKGYGTSLLFALVMLVGLGLSIAGLSCWIPMSRKTRNMLYAVALLVAVLACAFGPTLSGWWLERAR